MTPPLLLTCFDKTARWMRRGGREGDIVISSRVRLARNLRPYEFPHRASPNDLLTIRHRAWQALHATGENSGGLSDARLISFEDFNTWERQSLIDRHISSREHLEQELGRGVAASADASLSVMVNEEDHLRVQSLLPGLQLDGAHALVDKLDDALEGWFGARGGFAYSDSFGYLTACPTNAGTGLRAGVMMHLPALEITGKIERARRWAEDNRMTLRGTFGEGSKVWGHLHQLSNQTTMGVDEGEVLLKTEDSARQLCDMERRARESLRTPKWNDDARDKIGRAYGTLRFAHKIGCREATDCLSFLRLAHEIEMAKGVSRQRFNELMVWIRPAYLQVLHSRTVAGAERDTIRAAMLRPHINKIKLDNSITDVRELPPEIV